MPLSIISFHTPFHIFVCLSLFFFFSSYSFSYSLFIPTSLSLSVNLPFTPFRLFTCIFFFSLISPLFTFIHSSSYISFLFLASVFHSSSIPCTSLFLPLLSFPFLSQCVLESFISYPLPLIYRFSWLVLHFFASLFSIFYLTLFFLPLSFPLWIFSFLSQCVLWAFNFSSFSSYPLFLFTSLLDSLFLCSL